MTLLARLIATIAFALATGSIHAQAGKEKAATCAACHGTTGVSAIANTPSLAGQPEMYLQIQLVLFREKQRNVPEMVPFVEKLTDPDIQELATYFAALPIAVILLATVGVALFGPHPLARALWWAGSLAQWFVTAWVLARWWRGASAGGLQWASVTPALFIPIVGNVLVPLAGAPLGHTEWAVAQFGVGLLFWPVVLVLLVVRLVVQGLWPERLLPTAFILIAPPAVVGLSLLQLGAPVLWGWACWGMAVFSLLWAAALARRISAMPFGLPHWGMSFPLAALAALTLRLAQPGQPMAWTGLLLLALASLLIAGLLLATVRGLRDGNLLAPEPVATIAPTAAAVLPA